MIVASFTDAWIETAMQNPHFARTDVASFTDAWIETVIGLTGTLIMKSHLLQMRGLKQNCLFTISIVNSRIFYRCVD